MSDLSDYYHPFFDEPKKKKTPDEQRADATDMLEWLLKEDPQSASIERYRERAAMTDAQFEAEAAENEARAAVQRKADEEKRAAEEYQRHWQQLEKNGFELGPLSEAEQADVTKAAIVGVTNWAASKATILVLSGSLGCGKTTAAARWALKHCERYTAPLFLRASTLARTSRFDSDTRETWLNAPGLVLDDLGVEYADAKGSFQADLEELVDCYYGKRRPLIITTNVRKEEFKVRYRDRIADRLRECGTWFAIADGSLRGKAK
jgi:DNA replication protein DnaC